MGPAIAAGPPLGRRLRPTLALMDDDSKIIFFREPDPFERGVRLVCGALLGLVLGLWGSLRLRLPLWAGVGVTVGLIVVCASGARKYGDQFWYDILGARAWPWKR
jgi:hypothetical protein